MTIEEKKNALYAFCDGVECCEGCLLREEASCCFEEMSDKHTELIYSIAFPEEKSGIQEAMAKVQECGIKDSGNRTEFASGAVRDIQEGKGRCDLLPLDVVASIIPMQTNHHRVIEYITGFVNTSDTFDLVSALAWFRSLRHWDIPTMLLEVAIHFEEGAKKYGERNWEKGIPTERYIDSAIRHYLKWLRGDKDEPHDRAFCWNILCCILTCIHKPELNSYGKKGR